MNRKTFILVLGTVWGTLLVPQTGESQLFGRGGRGDQAADETLYQRWVGMQINTLPIWLDFFGDSMLVISDRSANYPVNFRATRREITVYGEPEVLRLIAAAFNSNRAADDFSFRTQYTFTYRFSAGRMLIEAEGTTITMSPQSVLARPLEATWRADLSGGGQMELLMDRQGNVRYRNLPGGSWRWGKWERAGREMVLDFNPSNVEVPDSSRIWLGIYDADGQQLVMESVGEGTSITIFKRIIRR
ncbi:MAG: hypothetical protein OEY63_00390 [Gemmatimonadota bacterium]|nr:hypothetical protein [Gemmatimonadota bacterium]MDH5803546.1 hypothetical protein [Gemmatimonadota bacterium]